MDEHTEVKHQRDKAYALLASLPEGEKIRPFIKRLKKAGFSESDAKASIVALLGYGRAVLDGPGALHAVPGRD